MIWQDVKCPFCRSGNFTQYDCYDSLINPGIIIHSCECEECKTKFKVTTRTTVISVKEES